jgi:hypothetical protein
MTSGAARAFAPTSVVAHIWDLLDQSPRFAAPNVEIPVQVKILVAADTGYRLFLTAHV